MESRASIGVRRALTRSCLCALLALILATAAAPAASAAARGSAVTAPTSTSGGSGGGSAGNGNAFNELSNGAQAEEPTQTRKTETSGAGEQSSNTKKTIVIGLIAAIALLLGVAFVIVRDARKVAPAGDGPVSEARSARDTAATMRKRRAKAKAARQQRKRTRSR